MTILDTIIEHKRDEVAERKTIAPIQQLERSPYFERNTYSLKGGVRDKNKSGIIAEIKRQSPSKGIINAKVSIPNTSSGYIQAGASALSILTDHKFFGGSNEDLTTARNINACPILRKDFTVDEYQVIEAKSIGADAILLIAAALSPKQIKSLAALARSLGLEILLEVHTLEELKANEDADADLIGVNNRDLKTFSVNIGLSNELAPHIPHTAVKVSESGIESVDTILELRKVGFEGFLMGQNFMQHERPEAACQEFITSLKNKSQA